MLATRASCLCLLGALVGCNGLQPEVHSPASVEYTVTDYDRDVIRIFLTAAGGSRVDLMPAEEGDAAYTVLLPTCAVEVERLARVIEALIGSPGPRRYPLTFRLTGNISIRCRRYGRETSIRGGPADLWPSHVWEGVAKQIETVGLLDLAKAVASREKAEGHVKRHDLDEAVLEYKAALKSYLTWAGVRCHRYGHMMIWEPWITMVFKYPVATGKHESWEVRGMPEDVMKLHGMTAEWAVRFLRYAWGHCTKAGPGLTLSRSGTTVTVSFVPVTHEDWNEKWTWGLPVGAIPPSVRDVLRKGPRPKDN